MKVARREDMPPSPENLLQLPDLAAGLRVGMEWYVLLVLGVLALFSLAWAAEHIWDGEAAADLRRVRAVIARSHQPWHWRARTRAR
jgi:hypothetical protein